MRTHKVPGGTIYFEDRTEWVNDADHPCGGFDREITEAAVFVPSSPRVVRLTAVSANGDYDILVNPEHVISLIKNSEATTLVNVVGREWGIAVRGTTDEVLEKLGITEASS